MSAGSHMVTNGGDTDGLFRAAFMQSGVFTGLGDMEEGQHYYDEFVARVGCAKAPDSLACLRQVPYEKIKAGMDASRGFFGYEVRCTLSTGMLTILICLNSP